MRLDVTLGQGGLPFIAHETGASSAATAPAPDTAPTWRQRIAAAFQDWRDRQRERAIRTSLARLDAPTLRDLGVHRSELSSIDAEWQGRVELTRRRIVGRNVEVIAPGLPRRYGADSFR
jgi:uncharacterized protein YjiS (DUF1127 family)